jgi:hypothetical protein
LSRTVLWFALVIGMVGCGSRMEAPDKDGDGPTAPGETGEGGVDGADGADGGATSEHSHNDGGTSHEPDASNAADASTGGEQADASTGGEQPDQTGADGGSGMDGGPPIDSLCEGYCDEVTKNCRGKYEQYRTFDACVEVCKRMPPGKEGDENVNSISCRVRQARFAASEAFLYCKSAGPLGAGKCGSNCVSYCSLMDATCTAKSTAGNVELSYFESSQECLADCASMPDDPTGPTQYTSSATVEPPTMVGNSIYCRTYHLSAGIEQDSAGEHCPHAMGGDPCIVQ